VNKLGKNLPALIGQYAVAAGLPAADATQFVTTYLTEPKTIASVPGFSAKVLAAAELGTRWAYAESLKWVWITSIPFGILAIITCLFIPNIRHYQTNRVAVAL